MKIGPVSTSFFRVMAKSFVLTLYLLLTFAGGIVSDFLVYGRCLDFKEYILHIGRTEDLIPPTFYQVIAIAFIITALAGLLIRRTRMDYRMAFVLGALFDAALTIYFNGLAQLP